MLTVIITTFNSEKTLNQCLDSVVNAGLDFVSEVVVCDDASNDTTLEILNPILMNIISLK